MDSSFGVFSRISFNDEKADSSTTTGTSAKVRQYDYGFNYWLSPNAVLKVDYENTKTYSDNKGTHGFNFGMGYQFWLLNIWIIPPGLLLYLNRIGSKVFRSECGTLLFLNKRSIF